jgi:flagellar basal-body rod modification protein FlgD
MSTQIADLGIGNSMGMGGVAGPSGEMGREEFLQLLVTQLQHQDPLEPTSNEDFIAQLATFSSLEQLQSINTGTQTGLLMQQSMSNALSTSLIGNDVLIDTSSVLVEQGSATDFMVDLAGEANLTVEISDADGTVVRTMEVSGEDGAMLESGEHGISWDGRNENGEIVEDGYYDISITAADAAGEDVASNSWLLGHVSGVRFSQGAAYVIVGGMEFTLADVIEIREPLAEVTVEEQDEDVEPGLFGDDSV